jgi:hypothetical protein
MSLTLDRNRVYGEIHGEHEHGAKFDQDGFFFDAHGGLIEEAMDDRARDRLEQLQAQDAAIEEARKAFRQIMPDADEATVSKIITAENLKKADAADEEIDLEAWGSGRKKYLFTKVAQKIRAEYSQSPANAGQAREILAEHGIIPSVGGTPTIPSMT